MRKKTKLLIDELTQEINMDDTMDSIACHMKKITYAPNLGYNSWIFRYKNILVALYDCGNGHYDFQSKSNIWQVIVAKLTLLTD